MRGDKKWYLYAARAGLLIGVASHRRVVSLNTIARGEDSDKPAHAATIFTHNGAPKALVGCLAFGLVAGHWGRRIVA